MIEGMVVGYTGASIDVGDGFGAVVGRFGGEIDVGDAQPRSRRASRVSG